MIITASKKMYIYVCICMCVYKCVYMYLKTDRKRLKKVLWDLKTEDIYEDFRSDEMLYFRNYSTKSKYYDISNKLLIGRMNNETGVVAIEEFVELKLKMCSFLVNNNEYEKPKRREKICCCSNRSQIIKRCTIWW